MSPASPTGEIGHHGSVNISAKTDYAVRAMLMLAQAERDAAGAERAPAADAAGGGVLVSAETLADQQGLPRKFLEAILSDLRRANLVTSVRGAGGGYRLARPASEIMLGAVFRAVDGPLAEVRGLRPHETTYAGAAEHLPTVWVAVRSSLRRVLDEVSLEQVLTESFPKHVVDLSRAPDAWANR